MVSQANRGWLIRACIAEAIGTAGLLAVIVGSGIMGERLAGGNAAIALLANSAATGLALWVLITTFGPLSGAHLNPLVSLVTALTGHMPWRHALLYVLVQVVFAFVGIAVAHLMFELPLFSASTHVRAGASQLVSEVVATAGLLGVIAFNRGSGAPLVGGLVGAYIAAAYWFTGSTSFANPAVTMARSATDTFSGIRPADVPGFIAAQLAVAVCFGVLLRVYRGHVVQKPGS